MEKDTTIMPKWLEKVRSTMIDGWIIKHTPIKEKEKEIDGGPINKTALCKELISDSGDFISGLKL